MGWEYYLCTALTVRLSIITYVCDKRIPHSVYLSLLYSIDMIITQYMHVYTMEVFYDLVQVF